MQKDLSQLGQDELADILHAVIVSDELSFEQKGAELHRIYEEGVVAKGKAIAKKHKVPARIPAFEDWIWQVKNITLKGRI